MINVSVYTSNNYFVWDEFVDNSNNGTIFHKLSFLDYHDRGKFKRLNLVFKRDGKILALLSGEIKKN